MNDHKKDLEICEAAGFDAKDKNMFNLPWLPYDRVTFSPNIFKAELTHEMLEFILHYSPSKVAEMLTEIAELREEIDRLKKRLECASDWVCACGALNHVKEIQCQFCLRMQGTK